MIPRAVPARSRPSARPVGRRVRRRTALGAAGLLVALVLSACDGGSDSGSAGGSTTAAATTTAPTATSSSTSSTSTESPSTGATRTTASPTTSAPSSATTTGEPTRTSASTPSARATDTGSVGSGAAPAGADPQGGSGGASGLWGKQYRGTANVTIETYDYCPAGAARRFTGRSTYSMPATLSLDRPHQGGGQVENNPFSFMMSVGQPSQIGAFTLGSSTVVTASGRDVAGNLRDPRLVLVYWKFGWGGGNLNATLTDTHLREGATLNMFNPARPLVPCQPQMGPMPAGMPVPVNTGATLSGSLTTSRASLTLRGGTTDGMEVFTFSFQGG